MIHTFTLSALFAVRIAFIKFMVTTTSSTVLYLTNIFMRIILISCIFAVAFYLGSKYAAYAAVHAFVFGFRKIEWDASEQS